MKIIAAEHVLPISSEPISGGAVVIDADKIVAVGDLEKIKAQFADIPVDDLGKAAILPGFVNCHSHLEVTSMRGALDDVEHDFRSWLLKLNDMRRDLSTADIETAAMLGVTKERAARRNVLWGHRPLRRGRAQCS